jgi:hypothetical protein
VGQAVWISDWNNDVVRRFAVDGEPLPNLQSAGLDEVLARSAEERRRYTVLSYAGVIVVGLMLFALIVQSFARSMNAGPARQPAADKLSDVAKDTVPLRLEPDEDAHRRMNGLVRIIFILTLLTVIPLVALAGMSDKPELFGKLIAPLAGLFAIAALVAWINRANWGTAISVDGDSLTLTDHTGRHSSCPIRRVRYDNTAIATTDAIVMLGRPQHRVYKEADVQEHLMPRLADAERVGAIEMLKIQVELRHPQGMVAVATIVAIVIYAVLQFAL